MRLLCTWSPEQCRFPPLPTPQVKRWRVTATHPWPLHREGKASSNTDPAPRTGPFQDVGRRGRRRATAVPTRFLEEPGLAPQPATRDPDADPACLLRFNPSSPKSAEPCCASGSPTAHAPTALRTFIPEPGQVRGSPPPPDPDLSPEDPDAPPYRTDDRVPPQPAPPSLNASLLQTLTHLGDIVTILGPLRDQLLTLNQHVEQLRGSFDQTVSLAVGFILGSAAAERGVLRDPRE
ncbi:Undifferentiated embryonic cell transcription factor 1 [Heterocephalus glaber]|uniref:Undifferentiated embryonic cell transcription factor 1 n=1 Tax=Heterocephalus glaber TaxID=10181 RepID=G5AVB5_HETGA|nr:Undifferentiated embryonic cell transcription factor 1 [Heterocephalus glaber]